MAQMSSSAFDRRRREIDGRERVRYEGSDAPLSASPRSLRERIGSASAALRLRDVPKPVLIALGILMVVALGLGWLLRGELLSSDTASQLELAQGLARSSAGSSSLDAPAAAVSNPSPSQGSGSAVFSSLDVDSGSTSIVVDVGGAVISPGVYTLPSTARVVDAIQAAGGLLADADTTSLNQAATVADGSKVYVPARGEPGDQPATPSATGTATGTQAGSSTAQGGIVNINTADVDELKTLPGVGEATAQAIVDEREQSGPFASVEDIMRVSGIGEKKFAKLQGLICI